MVKLLENSVYVGNFTYKVDKLIDSDMITSYDNLDTITDNAKNNGYEVTYNGDNSKTYQKGSVIVKADTLKDKVILKLNHGTWTEVKGDNNRRTLNISIKCTVGSHDEDDIEELKNKLRSLLKDEYIIYKVFDININKE